MENWLGDYMYSRQNPDGKNVFLAIDSRVSRHNPFYKAFKTKSFTDLDITLHFILLDLFEVAEEALPISKIIEQLDQYLSVFQKQKILTSQPYAKS